MKGARNSLTRIERPCPKTYVLLASEEGKGRGLSRVTRVVDGGRRNEFLGHDELSGQEGTLLVPTMAPQEKQQPNELALPPA